VAIVEKGEKLVAIGERDVVREEIGESEVLSQGWREQCGESRDW
jgi:hypothetical protein